MQHNEERLYREWRIVCKCSPTTRRSRYQVWSPNGINMRSFDHETSAEAFINDRHR